MAEIETKVQNISERLAFVEEFIKQQHAQAHEGGMQAMDQAHEHSITDKQAANVRAIGTGCGASTRRRTRTIESSFRDTTLD